MRYTLTGLAAALLAASALAAPAAPPERQALAARTQSGGLPAALAEAPRYTLHLSDAKLSDKALRAALAKSVPEAKLRWRSRLWPELAIVEGPEGIATKLQQTAGIGSVQTARYTPSPASRSTGKTTTATSGAKAAVRTKGAKAAEVPLSDDPQAGKDIRVGILSTGIDYTHAALGGAGTAAAYADALASAAAPYDGFPTSVVVGGTDFAAESFNLSRDRNPLDSNLVYPVEGAYPTGRGTYLASIVHRLAPGAKLVALKAYAIFDDETNVRRVKYNLEDLAAAFEGALDPNQDGDTSDHVDVLLYDDSSGSFAYYNPGSDSPSGDSLITDMIQGVTARGIPVVAGSGELIYDSLYSIATAGSVPDAVTVGGIERVGTADAVAAFSGRGPVRGTAAFLKPDLVSDAVDISGATVGSSTGSETRTGLAAASARVAAALAIVKQQRPALSGLELKAALVNTGMRAIGQDAAHATQAADVSRAGLGRENLAGAAATPLLAWDEDTRQPSMFVGFHEVVGSERYVRHLRIRNVSTQDHSYALNVQRIGDKPGFAALGIEAPATVQV
ncbi:MAG: S8 family serine peptidase, partial [Solimonas sp.]